MGQVRTWGALPDHPCQGSSQGSSQPFGIWAHTGGNCESHPVAQVGQAGPVLPRALLVKIAPALERTRLVCAEALFISFIYQPHSFPRCCCCGGGESHGKEAAAGKEKKAKTVLQSFSLISSGTAAASKYTEPL